MRILLLSTYFKPDIAATGVLMTQLMEELAALGHQVTVITTMPHYDTNRIWDDYRGRLWVKEKWGTIDVYRVYLYVPPRKGSIAGRLLNYASFNALSLVVGALAGRTDVVLAASPPLTNGIAAFLLGRLRRVPYIYNVQDVYPDVAIRLGVLKDPRLIRFFKWLERFVYDRAAAVIVLSDGIRRNLLAKGQPEGKIHLIPNFVDTGFIWPRPRHNAFSAAQGLDGRFVVLFAGNVGLSQGLETVLETARRLKDVPDVLFLLVGNGAAKAGLMAAAAEMGLPNARFLPFQPHEDVPELYASADLCLVPLRRGLTEESVPSKVFTILGAGRPLVAAVDRDSDTWRLVEQAGCGLTVEPEDPGALAEAILSLYHDRALGERMGKAGRQFVATHYTLPGVARQYHDLLNTLARPGEAHYDFSTYHQRA